MQVNNRLAAAVCLLLFVFTFHMLIAWQDLETLARNGYLYDDSFYAFQIARNIAHGNGMTFDGIHPTTGFQPLYVFLLVPVYMIAGSDPALPIQIALSLLAVFTTLTALLIFKIARRYAGFGASLVAAGLWALSPIVTKQSANGLETALAAFMIALCSWYYLDRVRPDRQVRAGRLFILGLLLGMMVLTRIDGTFLVLAILLDYLLLLRRRRAGTGEALRVSLVLPGILVFYGPWLLLNIIRNGSPLQDSGTATRFLSLAYTQHFGYGAESLATKGPDLNFIRSHLTHTIASLKVVPLVHVVFRVIDKLGSAAGSNEGFRAAGDVFGFILLFLAGSWIFRWKEDTERSRRFEIGFLFLFSGLLFLSYSLYVFGSFFFLRYYYPVYMLAAICTAFLFQDLYDWISRRKTAARRVIAVSAAAYALLFASFSYSQAFRSRQTYPFYDIAAWVDANTEEEDTIGVFQCGTIGYFSHRRIINLDGKVNHEALCALKKGRICNYLVDEGIDLVIDHCWVLEVFLGRSGKELESICTKIGRGKMKHPSGWIAIRTSVLESLIQQQSSSMDRTSDAPGG